MGSPSDRYLKVSCTAPGIKRMFYDPVNPDDDYTPAFLSPGRKFSTIDEPLLRPSKISSPNRNVLHKEALRRAARNKNILLWLQICPSHNSLNVRLVSIFINISKLENKTL